MIKFLAGFISAFVVAALLFHVLTIVNHNAKIESEKLKKQNAQMDQVSEQNSQRIQFQNLLNNN